MITAGTELLAYWARECGRLGLVRCSSGNLSHRIDSNTVLISATGSWLPDLEPIQVAHLDFLRDCITGNVQPSAEYRLHREIYLRRNDVDTILHFQSPSATTLACMDVRPDYNVIIEVPLYIGTVGHLPLLQPGSEALAQEAGSMMTSVNLIQLANHGQVVCGKGYRDTIQKAVFFELACTILLNSDFRAQAISGGQLAGLQNYNRRID